MNLKQAYQGWQQQSQNRELYVKTREAFRKAWFTLLTYNDLMEYTKDPLADPDKIGKKQEEDDTDLYIDPVTALPRRAMAQEALDAIKVREHVEMSELDLQRLETDTVPEPCDEHGNALPDDSIDPLAGIDFSGRPNPYDGCNNVKGFVTCINGSERAVITETKSKTEDMEQKKTRGKQPKPVAQLDAKTLQVIRVWPSRSEAERELGACNLDRAIARKRLSAGFFWCSPEDVDGFQPNPMSKPIKVKTTVSTAVPQQPSAQKIRTAATAALTVFTDDELLKELDVVDGRANSAVCRLLQ